MTVHQEITMLTERGFNNDWKSNGRLKTTRSQDEAIIRRTNVLSPSSIKSNSAAIKSSFIKKNLYKNLIGKEFCLDARKPAFKPHLTPATKITRL